MTNSIMPIIAGLAVNELQKGSQEKLVSKVTYV